VTKLKTFGIGIGTLLLGFILSMLLANTFSSGNPNIGSSYIGFIGFSILYLASVVAVCTYTIKKKNND
jgi:asparagine N-glycosylation enzyme membrane subunit Stt3